MKKILVLMSALLLVVLLASCVVSPKEKDADYDFKITLSGITGTDASANGTYYFNSTLVKGYSASSFYYLYTDEACTNQKYKICFGYSDGTVSAQILSTSYFTEMTDTIVKTKSIESITLKPGKQTKEKEGVTFTIEVLREVSFDLTKYNV